MHNTCLYIKMNEFCWNEAITNDRDQSLQAVLAQSVSSDASQNFTEVAKKQKAK